MRKNRKYLIFIVVVLIIQVSSFYFVPSTTQHSSFSKSKIKGVDPGEKNIERKIREDLRSSENPGNFTLTTNKNSIFVGLNFTLSWTVSEGADNYSIYMSTKSITVIDGNSTLINAGLTKLNKSVLAIFFGLKYYVAVAYNVSGNTLSNSVKIDILVPESGGNERDLWKAGFGLSDILNPYLVIIIVIIFSIIGVIQYKHMKTYKFRSEYKQFSNKNKHYAENTNKILKIKSAQEIMKKIVENKTLLDGLNIEKDLEKYELDSVTMDFFHKVDSFKWDDESQKVEFISEMLALSPEERDDILNYMIEKSNKNNIFI